MHNPFQKKLKQISDLIYKYFVDSSTHNTIGSRKGHVDPGKMLLLTTALGTGASALAQTGAVLYNDKYTTSQKAFMIPQELIEGAISIISIAFVSTPLSKMAKQYVKSGKLINRDLYKFCEKHNLLENRGKKDFNISDTIENLIKKAEANNEPSGTIRHLTDMRDTVDMLSDSASAIATTAGTMIATATVSPILKNAMAAHFQKSNIKHINQYEEAKQQELNTYKNYKNNLYSYSSNGNIGRI